MKAFVKEDCISCGTCVSMCPNVFAMEQDEIAHVEVSPIPDNLVECAVSASEACPVNAIMIGND